MSTNQWLFLFAFCGALGGIATVAQLFMSIWFMSDGKTPKAKVSKNPLGIYGKRLALVVACLLLSAVLSLLGFIRAMVSPTGTVPLTKAWGGSPGSDLCSLTVDGPQLIPYREKYDVAFACGFNDNTHDKFEDDRITISHGYTIVNRDLGMSSPYSATMMNMEKQLLDEVRRAVPPNTPKGTPIAVHAGVWYEPLLLPKGTDAGRLRSRTSGAMAATFYHRNLPDKKSHLHAKAPLPVRAAECVGGPMTLNWKREIEAMVLSPNEELLIKVVRMLPPEEVGKVLVWAQQLADLGGGRRVEWSGSWSDGDLRDATVAPVERFEQEERERR